MKSDTPEWYRRWKAAVLAYHNVNPRKRSLAQISKDAGIKTAKGKARPGYLSDNFAKSQMPSVDKFIAVCDVIGVSPAGILLGEDWTKEDEARIRRFARFSPMKRDHLLGLAEAMERLRDD